MTKKIHETHNMVLRGELSINPLEDKQCLYCDACACHKQVTLWDACEKAPASVEVALAPMLRKALPPYTVIADSALEGMVGQTCPVYVGEGDLRRQVGEAMVFKSANGVNLSVRLAGGTK